MLLKASQEHAAPSRPLCVFLRIVKRDDVSHVMCESRALQRDMREFLTITVLASALGQLKQAQHIDMLHALIHAWKRNCAATCVNSSQTWSWHLRLKAHAWKRSSAAICVSSSQTWSWHLRWASTNQTQHVEMLQAFL